MKRLFTIACLVLVAPLLLAQDAVSKLELNFFAVIVSDIETSVTWYVEKLGFKVLDQVNIEDRGLSQANLMRGRTRLELIATKDALLPSDVLTDERRDSRLAGFFKIGFAISDFDTWIKHLKQIKVTLNGDIVRDSSGKKMVVIKDPDGNRIQFFEQ